MDWGKCIVIAFFLALIVLFSVWVVTVIWIVPDTVLRWWTSTIAGFVCLVGLVKFVMSILPG